MDANAIVKAANSIVQKKQMLKSGYSTTEFWQASAVASFLVNQTLEHPDQWYYPVSLAIVAAGYAVSRALAKRG